MPSLDPPTSAEYDYYAILGIPLRDASARQPLNITKQQLKNAYHKALLRYHPDKNKSSSSTTLKTIGDTKNLLLLPTYTIDDITNAYKVLSSPILRPEYDRNLILRRKDCVSGRNGSESDQDQDVLFHTGLEIVDLEDMIEEEEEEEDDQEGSSSMVSSVWYRGCRCGDEKGFVVSEDELEAEAQHGEILVGCRGCSLWIKVLFAVEDDTGEARKDDKD